MAPISGPVSMPSVLSAHWVSGNTFRPHTHAHCRTKTQLPTPNYKQDWGADPALSLNTSRPECAASVTPCPPLLRKGRGLGLAVGMQHEPQAWEPGPHLHPPQERQTSAWDSGPQGGLQRGKCLRWGEVETEKEEN